jgi:GxxExxY protein
LGQDCSQWNAGLILDGISLRSLYSLRGNLPKKTAMQPNEITGRIVDAAYHVHTKMGPGLLETVYEVALDFELKKRGLRSRRQVPIPVEYEGVKFDEGFRADLLVEESVIVEIKAVEKNHPVHARQLRTHLVLAKLPVGLVLNFGLERIKDGITRIVNGLPE